MKKQIPYWQTAGFIFTAIVGTFLHFLFDLTGGSTAAALISATNESIWEHMKLLFYPMFLFAIVEYFCWGKEIPGFWTVKLWGMLLGLLLIPVIYYTYTGVSGMNVDWLNIAIFFLAAGAAFYLESKLFPKPLPFSLSNAAAFGIFCLLAVTFTVFTFYPPSLPLFQSPG